MIIRQENAHVLTCTLRFSWQVIIQPRLKSKNLVQPNIQRE